MAFAAALGLLPGCPGESSRPGANDCPGRDTGESCSCDSGEGGSDRDGDGYEDEACGGEDCDDGNAAINPAATDLVGDGIDQNCDGVDGTDADGDGWASELSGGEDCDDGDASYHPGAEDEVGDERDQSCDGIDGTDADGDGWASTESGGEDCDDGNPAIAPDATEAVNDIDDDCNGWVDERRVCPDGSAEFTSVQEAADTVPDGLTLLLCEGVHEGSVTLVDRELHIRGESEDPGKVVMENGSGLALTVSGERSDVQLSWLTLQGEGSRTVDAEDGGELTFDTVLFTGSPTTYHVRAQSIEQLTIVRSYLEGARVFYGEDVASVEIAYNIILDGSIGWFGYGALEAHHNLMVGSEGLSLHGFDYEATSAWVHHNTVADASSWTVYVSWYEEHEMLPVVDVSYNIIAFVENGSLYDVLWMYGSGARELEPEVVAPASFGSNTIFQVPDPLATIELQYVWPNIYTGSFYDTSLSESIEYDNVFGDPQFYDGAGGSYTPASGGIAADEGAFSAADGDWYLDVPWEFP